jgi:Domain of unknown function (DUF4390)
LSRKGNGRKLIALGTVNVVSMLRTLRQEGFAPALILMAMAAFAVWSAGVRADALDGVLEVRSAYVNVDHGVFLLHARVEYPINPEIRDTLRDGITLTFELETGVARERRFWFDADIVDLTLRRELMYHAVSNRYVVRDPRTSDQQSFPTLETALSYLGTIDGWPILVEPQLQAGDRYRVRIRAGIRRGRLPASLRAMLFWTDDWHRVSEWYSWSLPM